MLSNGNSFSNSHSMDLANGNSMGTGDSYGGDGSRPPSWWFTFPADAVWRL